jgi:hypothetical protein
MESVVRRNYTNMYYNKCNQMFSFSHLEIVI